MRIDTEYFLPVINRLIVIYGNYSNVDISDEEVKDWAVSNLTYVLEFGFDISMAELTTDLLDSIPLDLPYNVYTSPLFTSLSYIVSFMKSALRLILDSLGITLRPIFNVELALVKDKYVNLMFEFKSGG